jgi:ketosteroid isomerase-like protein
MSLAPSPLTRRSVLGSAAATAGSVGLAPRSLLANSNMNDRSKSEPLKVILALVEARRVHDYPKAFRFYARDAVVTLSPGKQARGEDAIKAWIVGVSNLSLTFDQHEIWESYDVALHTSRYILDQGEDGRVLGRTSDVLRRDVRGNWKIIIDNAFVGRDS